MTYKLLPLSFFMLQYVGLWQPDYWPASWKTRLYLLCTIFAFVLFYVDVGSQIIDLVLTAESVTEYINRSFILLTLICICGKMASIVKNRKRIIDIVKTLTSGSFCTRNPKEEKIRQQFEKAMK